MKKIIALILTTLILFSFSACSQDSSTAQVVATTLPVYEFTGRLCAGTGITVDRLITENTSCLHDYTLQVSQMRAIEGAELVVISGAGLEDTFADALQASRKTIDASAGIKLLCGHNHEHHEGHDHGEEDPHIWLSPANGILMAENICTGLCNAFPDYASSFKSNLSQLTAELTALDNYGQEQLSGLTCRELITFHDGFAYLADRYDLTILQAVEEESGSEAAAKELIGLIRLVEDHDLPAIFTERNGNSSAAQIICKETGSQIYQLDMAMSGSSYFDAMYHNIDTLKEALE